MKLLRTIFCAAALIAVAVPANAQSAGALGAAATTRTGHIDRVIVGEAAATAGIPTPPPAGLYEGRSVAPGKRHCWINVYGDRQCEYR